MSEINGNEAPASALERGRRMTEAGGRARPWHGNLREIARLLRYLAEHEPMLAEESERVNVAAPRTDAHCEFERALAMLDEPFRWNGDYDLMLLHEERTEQLRLALEGAPVLIGDREVPALADLR